jgi:hypothetical protein
MDAEFKYIGIEIACPRRTKNNGDIECYWIAKWPGRNRIKLVEPSRISKNDLDEITALPLDDKKSKS